MAFKQRMVQRLTGKNAVSATRLAESARVLRRLVFLSQAAMA